MASFQAKIGWKMRRKRENKNSLSVPYLPEGKDKIQKIKKPSYGFFSSQNRLKKAEKKRK